jgi:hypothetical protein
MAVDPMFLKDLLDTIFIDDPEGDELLRYKNTYKHSLDIRDALHVRRVEDWRRKNTILIFEQNQPNHYEWKYPESARRTSWES